MTNKVPRGPRAPASFRSSAYQSDNARQEAGCLTSVDLMGAQAFATLKNFSGLRGIT